MRAVRPMGTVAAMPCIEIMPAGIERRTQDGRVLAIDFVKPGEIILPLRRFGTQRTKGGSTNDHECIGHD